ncbi:putative immunity protein [Planctomycetota bacterium]
MRDQRYKAAHRGGPLGLQQHRLLAAWAADCAEHVLPRFTCHHPEECRPSKAIEAAQAWSRGEITVGAARTASVAAHAAAREVHNEAPQHVARAAGHAVATAHMADHAPRAAAYAIKAMRAASREQDEDAAVEQEHRRQRERLPEEIRELVLPTFERRFAYLGL